ncbi:DUF2238 domain-containing protein [Heliophilum fasciatum]|uniref:Putative membrane protein n=1 Tax=Heliophilum fasciatum TaxID=35700 RepID=A0A4V2SWJ4_9FIRM|nr:DUF2238 domain-containing protein [Heliophilum fasciatum]MCW2278612.1 putative membrane protein [Heliophilum fasciatum]TCP62686.1 putative membrane protein [Heliophilum fasciatum]
MTTHPWHLGLLVTVAAVFLWSAIKPASYTLWMMEMVPLLLGVALLALTYRRLTLTTLCYGWIAACLIWGAVGGHYGYSHVPWFDWLKDHFHLQRNHFDRVGHFIQGIATALVARELLLRLTPMKPGWLLTGYVLAAGLALSSIYEFFEWAVVGMGLPLSADFAGMQGDPWDAQWDMFLAFAGSVLALTLFTGYQDQALRQKLWQR